MHAILQNPRRFDTAYLPTNGIETFYQSVTPGSPTIVFIHGWSFNLEAWTNQVSFFANTTLKSPLNVVSYDLRGMGVSTGQFFASSFDDYVSDLHDLITGLGIVKPILCGHSMGGGIAMQYAAMYPGNISGLILADSPLQTLKAAAMDLFVAYGMKFVTQHPHLFPATADLWELGFYSAKFRKSHPAVMASWRHQYLSNVPNALYEAFLGYAKRSASYQKPANFTMPVLLVRGSQDPFTTDSEYNALQQALPNAVYQQIKGAGHCSFIEQPKVFNNFVKAFLQSKLGITVS